MTEPRVESVSEAGVVVSPDPDGVLGELVAALMAENGEQRLKAIARGELEALAVGGLALRRLTERGEAKARWIVSRGKATAIVTGEAVERLVWQAYDHRRWAAMQTFPIGGTFARGRFVIIDELRGVPVRGMYRARDVDGPTTYLVTMGPPQKAELSALRRALAFDVPGIAPLAYLGRLEPHSEAGYEGMLEREPAGLPVSALAPPIARAAALRIALDVARVIRGAHAAGIHFGTLRPELIYVQSAATPVVTEIAPRADRFWLTASDVCFGVAPCFDSFYLAPEQLARPFDPITAATDVFALGAMLAHGLTGEPPFDGEGTPQAMSIMLGCRRPFAGPPELAALIDRALAPEPAARITLDAWIGALEAATASAAPAAT